MAAQQPLCGAAARWADNVHRPTHLLQARSARHAPLAAPTPTPTAAPGASARRAATGTQRAHPCPRASAAGHRLRPASSMPRMSPPAVSGPASASRPYGASIPAACPLHRQAGPILTHACHMRRAAVCIWNWYNTAGTVAGSAITCVACGTNAINGMVGSVAIADCGELAGWMWAASCCRCLEQRWASGCVQLGSTAAAGCGCRSKAIAEALSEQGPPSAAGCPPNYGGDAQAGSCVACGTGGEQNVTIASATNGAVNPVECGGCRLSFSGQQEQHQPAQPFWPTGAAPACPARCARGLPIAGAPPVPA